MLLAAYEFPPSSSPQSLRWAYLARELAGVGVEACVVAPRAYPEAGGLPPVDGISVERTFPGPFMGAISLLRRKGGARPAANDIPGRDRDPAPGAAPALNWRGRLVGALQAVFGAALFPDIRAEWMPWAKAAVRRQLAAVSPHVVVTSHEPACVLELGIEAKRRGFKWVADLGDPVCAVYTPRRWRRRAHALERKVCEMADHITVTSEPLRTQLSARHSIPEAKISVVTQGFDAARAMRSRGGDATGPLELLYTGSLYGFRRPDELLEAVVAADDVRLTIVSRQHPERLAILQSRYPGRIALMVNVPHREVLLLQEQADVLVDIANDQPEQVPGKFYEYLGASRPVLHIGPEGTVAAVEVLRLGRGWVCPNERTQLEALLRELSLKKSGGALDAGLQLGRDTVAQYSWRAQAQRMRAVFDQVLGNDRAPAPEHEKTETR